MESSEIIENDSEEIEIIPSPISSISPKTTEKLTFSFGKCKICSDAATGIHYGISTCEGCKGFYKRSLDKYQSYFCYNQNKCVVSIITRNRCKSCRFKKCIKEGMSIDGIRMGRIPKSEKLKALNRVSVKNSEEEKNFDRDNLSNQDQDEDTSESDEGKDEINSTVEITDEKQLDELPFRRKEFKYWLSNQIKFVRENDITKIETKNKNDYIKLSLNMPLENLNKTPSEVFNILRQHQLFESTNILPTTIFQAENELFLISILKDKVFQLFKKHTFSSTIINHSTECFKNKDYIDSSVENISVDELLIGLVGSISEHSKWLTRFVKELPGFNKLNLSDFMTIVSSTSLLLFNTHQHQFFYNNENHFIISNRYQLSRERMNTLYGAFKTGLLFEFHNVIKKFKFSETELSLLYTFFLTGTNVNLIHDKENFIELKNYYDKMIIYEFELNGRDENFFEDLKQLFEIIEVLEIRKGKFNPNIKQ